LDGGIDSETGSETEADTSNAPGVGLTAVTLGSSDGVGEGRAVGAVGEAGIGVTSSVGVGDGTIQKAPAGFVEVSWGAVGGTKVGTFPDGTPAAAPCPLPPIKRVAPKTKINIKHTPKIANSHPGGRLDL